MLGMRSRTLQNPNLQVSRDLVCPGSVVPLNRAQNTNKNSSKTRRVFNTVRSTLGIVAILMLLISLLRLDTKAETCEDDRLILERRLAASAVEIAIQVEAESLRQSNELDEMNEKLETRKLVMGNTSMHSTVVEEKVRNQEEQLGSEIRSLLVARTTLSASRKCLLISVYNVD